MNQIINSCLTALNSIGRGFCDYTAGMFVQSSVLIVLLLIIDFLLRKRVRAVFRYCVWMLVFVKLILPPTLCLPTGIGYWCGDYLSTDSSVLVLNNVEGSQQISNVVQQRPDKAVAPVQSRDREGAVTAYLAPGFTGGSNEEHLAPNSIGGTNEMDFTRPTPAVPSLAPITWQAVVFLLWLVGVLIISVLLIQRILFVKGLIAQSEPVKNRLLDVLNRCRQRVGIRRNIELRLSNSISAPAVCGLFEPVILIPIALLEKLSPDKLRTVLIHELVHIKRADIWVNLVQTILQIIYFYNPFVWLANAVVRRVREQAVDEMVLVTLGAGAKSYSNTLIDIAEMAFWKTSLSLRLIGVVESKKALHKRIRYMLNRPIPKKAKLGILGLIAVIIIAAVLLPMAASKPGPPSLVIKGMVKDAQTGELIAGARVFDDGYGPEPNWEQIKADVRSEWGAITNSAGEYSFLTWPEHHSIKVEAPGYKAERRSLYSGHFVFNTKDEEIFDFALKPEKILESSVFKKTLPNGVTVELVGLFVSESKGQLTWWRPDGIAMSKEEFEPYQYKVNLGHIRNRDDWKHEYGYVLKFIPSDDLSSMTDVTVGDKMRYTFPREDGIGVAYVESDEYQRKKGLAKIGEIRAAAAYGQPNSFSSENRVGQDADVFQLDDGATILLSAVRPDRYEPDRGLMVDTTVNAGDVDIKVFYESKNGNIRNAWADGTTGGPSLVSPHKRSKTLIQQTFRLHSIAKEELKKIIVECRRFQGITFKNIALTPGLTTAVTAEYIQPQEQINAIIATQADSIYPGEPASRRPRQPIAVENVRPMNPEFTAKLDNETSVELLALTKFESGALRWWSPEGQPIELPSITAQDIKHQGNIAAFRFYGPVDSFTSYCMIASSMHEIKEKWQIASSGVWLGVLGYPEERNFGKLYFRTKGKPDQTIYTIPIKPNDIGKRHAINQYGVNKIQSFERTAFDGFTIELLHDDKLAGNEFAAVDRAGKMHEYTEGYSTRNRTYMKYNFPAEELAAIVRQKFSYSTVQFVNVSLQGKKTKVVIEHIQRGEPEQPRVNVDVDPKFIATMPNGVKVSLVALGRLVDGSLQWWTPQAEHTSIPEILECDVEGYDVVLAYKVQGSNGFTSYSLQDDQLHRNKDDWLVRSHQLWMVSLDETTHVGTADFAVRAYGGPVETRLEIPLSEKEIGQEIEVNKLGYKKVAEFIEVTPDSFRVKVTYNSKKRALGEFAAVDKAGKTHKRISGAFWPGQCEVTFPISAKSLSHLVLQRQQIGQATFRNISLQPGQSTKVRIESRQVDYLIPPSQAKWSVQDITTDVQVEGAGGKTAKSYRKRYFATLVVTDDGVVFKGQKLTWEQVQEKLKTVPDRQITALEVAFDPAIVPDNLRGSAMLKWVSQSAGFQKAAQLRQELGFEYLSNVGVDRVSSRRGPVSVRFEDALRFGEQIPVALMSFEEQPLLRTTSIEFEKAGADIRAVLKAAVTSYPRKRWEIGVRLLDGQGRQFTSVVETFENSGLAVRYPVHTQEEMNFSFGQAADLANAKRFEVKLRQFTNKLAAGKTDVQVEDEIHWGEAVEGLQTCLWADKYVWSANETPEFHFAARNIGTREMTIIDDYTFINLVIIADGNWEQNQKQYLGNTDWGDLLPNERYNGKPIRINNIWESTKSEKDHPSTKPWKLSSGKHIIYMKIVAPNPRRSQPLLHIISNPVEIEILPDEKADVQVEGKERGKKNGSKWISHSAETNKSQGAQRQIVIEARVFSIKTPNTSIPDYLYSKLGIKNVNTETPLMMPVQLTNEQADEFEKWASAIPGTTTLVSPRVTAVNGELVDLTLTTQHELIMSYKKPEDSSGKPEPVLEKFTTGVKLGITPELQRDGKAIALKLAFSKNDLVRVKKDLNESGYEIELPVLNTVAINTNVLVASGKNTLVPVAGLFSTGKIEAGGKPIQQTLLLVKTTILNLASGLRDKPDVQVEAVDERGNLAERRKLYLPDLETPDAKVVLDFATGQMLSADKMENDRHYFDKSGKGDLVYEYASGQSGLLCLRGARMQIRTADGLSSLKPDVQRSNFVVYFIKKVPCKYQITTAEGSKYELKFLSVDKGDKSGAHVEYWKSDK